LAANAALRRLFDPAEIGRVVAFPASDAASAMTVVNIPVDCGWLAGTSWSTHGGRRKASG
jgi:NAD(P)-dependent dehydrogenase (short-subunit alcohol dehydrogenase family)